MKTSPAYLNLLGAWMGILLGFLSGLVLGLYFHRDDWLGGYGSLRRRLYRLAHISLFGLGVVNLCFYFTAQHLPVGSLYFHLASWSFIAGAVLMPACCLLTAHLPSARLLFALPVVSLLLGAVLTVGLLWHSDPSTGIDKPLLTAFTTPIQSD